MKSKWILGVLTFVTTTILSAGDIDGGAVVGSMVGAGVGSAVGSAAGGKNGAIIGGGLGGAVGAAVGSSEPARTETHTVHRDVVYVEDRGHHDNGKHKGHHKHHNGN